MQIYVTVGRKHLQSLITWHTLSVQNPIVGASEIKLEILLNVRQIVEIHWNVICIELI